MYKNHLIWGKKCRYDFLSSEVYFSAAPSIVGEFQVPQFRVSAASPRKKLNRSSFFRNSAAVRAHAHSTRGQLAGSGRLIILSFRQLIRRPRKRNVATELRFCGMSPAEWPSVRPPLVCKLRPVLPNPIYGMGKIGPRGPW